MVFTQNQLADITNITKSVVKKCFADNDFLENIATLLSKKVGETLEEQIGQLNRRCEKLEDSLQTLKVENKQLSGKIDRLEQSQNSSCLRIYGMKEEVNEDLIAKIETEIFKEKLKVNEARVLKCYRIGRNRNFTKPRSIFVKLESDKMCQQVCSNRKLLKGSNFVIAEELTRCRYQLLKEAKEKLGRTNAWSWRGSVYVRIGNEKKICSNIEDLKN